MLGIALVVDDVRKGPKLAFSYPLSVFEVASSVLLNSSKQSAASNQTPAFARPGGTAPGGGSARSGMERAKEAADYFAHLFRPRPDLCNAPFQLSVDTTTFISYPINLTAPPPPLPATTVPATAPSSALSSARAVSGEDLSGAAR
ncbi:hypothetical protein EON67_06075, partial [archaeon]